jgi:hypothetical protein
MQPAPTEHSRYEARLVVRTLDAIVHAPEESG